MAFTITENSILDFAVIQAMSIFYLSEAALHLMKWMDSESQSVRRLSEPPAVAWYEKATGTNLKLTSSAARPCMKTTGYSIQVLSRMADILPDYKVVSCLSSTSLHMEWKSIAALQLQFCLEYQNENSCTPEECSAILEGGAYLLKAGDPVDEAQDFLPALHKLSQKIMEILDVGMTGTMELANVARGISAWLRYSQLDQRNDFLSSLVLEMLNRKSRSGLFHYGAEGHAPVPAGQQFFILDALLQSYSFIQLDYVLEEVFDMFSKLYRVSYKDTIELFAFKRRDISYTAFEIGALLTCLNSIAEFSSDESGQRNTINNIIDSFLELLVSSYNKYHEKEIKRLIRWICLSHEGIAERKDKPHIRTVFPKRIHFSYPYAEITWSRKGFINQTDVLYLCSSLLSLISKDVLDEPCPVEIEMDIPTMETMKMLFDLFIHQ